MSFVLSLKIVVILILAIASGSIGGIAYYYQARTSELNRSVSDLSSNANSLSAQIAVLKAEIANLTDRISVLETINSQLNQTSLQVQFLEAELAAASAQLQSLETQLNNEISNVQAIESSFETQLSALNSQLAQDQAEIVQLQAQISQLQAQLVKAGGQCLSGKTISIGELVDLSAGLSTQGVRAKDGSTLAISDVNSMLATAGCTLRFSLAVDDYALDNQKALVDLQVLTASGVQVVIGPLNSAALANLIPFADANHIVLISPSSTSAGLAMPASPTKYYFRTAPDDRWQGMADARMIQAEGATKLIVVQRHDTYGDALANSTATDFNYLVTNKAGTVGTSGCSGTDTVCVIPYDQNTQDFTATIATLNIDFNALNATAPNKVAVDVVAFEEFSQLIYQIGLQHPNLLTGQLPGCLVSDATCTCPSSGCAPTSMWTGTDGEAQDTVISSNATSASFFAKNRLPSTVYSFPNNTKTIRLYTAFANTYPR